MPDYAAMIKALSRRRKNIAYVAGYMSIPIPQAREIAAGRAQPSPDAAALLIELYRDVCGLGLGKTRIGPEDI